MSRSSEVRTAVSEDNDFQRRALLGVLNGLGESVALLDGNGRMLFASPGVSQLIGFDAEGYVGKVVAAEASGTNRDAVQQAIAAARAAPRTVVTGRVVIAGKPIELKVCSMLDDPAIGGVIALARDSSALEQSEGRFHAIMSSLHQAVLMFDGEGRVLFANDVGARALGTTPAELEGQLLSGFVDDEAGAALWAEVLASPRRAVPSWQTVRARDGSTRILEGVVSNFLDDPNIRAVVATARDASEEHAMRAKLAQSERKFRALVDSSSDVVAIFDADGAIAFVGGAVQDLFGLSAEQMRDVALLDRVHPQDTTIAAHALEHLRQPRARFRAEFRARHEDGSYKVVELSGVNLIDDEAVGGVVVHLRDLTMLRLAEDAALERARQQASLADLSLVAVHAPNIDELRIAAVETACRTLAASGAEVLYVGRDGVSFARYAGKGLSDLGVERVGRGSLAGVTLLADAPLIVPSLADEQRFKPNKRLLDDGFTTALCAPIRGTDRSVGIIAAYRAGAPFTPEDSNVLVAIAAIIGEKQREMEARELLAASDRKFREAQKMEAIGQLAAGIAHDFNNLLVGILGYTHLLRDGLPPNDERQTDVEEIRLAADRAASLTRQILAFSRQQVLKRQAVDLNAIIEDMLKLLRRVIGEDVAVEFQGAGHLPPVHADAGQLEQVLLNLAVNARDAMPTGGRLVIKTAPAQPDDPRLRRLNLTGSAFAVLSVADSGTGMTQAVLERIFEPFFTTKELGRGTGLGLATVHGIVSQHGGGIDVESEPQQGTSFYVYLPCAVEVTKGIERSERAGPPRGSETILLAEDDETVRRLTIRVLTAAGYRVLVACDGYEALGLFDAHEADIDLALLDVVMPGLGGRAVLRAMRQRRPRLRFILASGYSHVGAAGGLSPDEAADWVQKPYDPDGLLRKVRDVLDRTD